MSEADVARAEAEVVATRERLLATTHALQARLSPSVGDTMRCSFARRKKRRAGRLPAQQLESRVGACERIPKVHIFELELLQPIGLDVTCGTKLRFPSAKRRAADAVIPT